MEQKKRTDVIHWTQLQRTQIRLTPKMWRNPEGDIIPVKDNLIGESRTRGHIPGWHSVLFDKGYVAKFLISKVIIPLMITSREEAIALVNQVWDTYQKESTSIGTKHETKD